MCYFKTCVNKSCGTWINHVVVFFRWPTVTNEWHSFRRCPSPHAWGEKICDNVPNYINTCQTHRSNNSGLDECRFINKPWQKRKADWLVRSVSNIPVCDGDEFTFDFTFQYYGISIPLFLLKIMEVRHLNNDGLFRYWRGYRFFLFLCN